MATPFADYLGLPVLVTGGAGFIGSHLVRALLGVGAHVFVLDNLSTGKAENLADVEHRIGFITGDVASIEDCRRAVDGRMLVFHLAALGSVPASIADPLASNKANVTGTLNMLDASRQAGVRRFIYSSSSSIYGDTPELPKIESMTPNPRSPYAVSKLVGEYYARVYADVYGMQTVSLRYFNVFGPRQDPRSQYAAVIPAFIDALLSGRRPRIYGDGLQTRDFCYVANVVYANMLAGVCDRTLSGEAVNIGTGTHISLNAMLRMLQEQTGQAIEAEHVAPRPGDVRDSLASITAAEALLGYRPLVGFAEGLTETVNWFNGPRR